MSRVSRVARYPRITQVAWSCCAATGLLLATGCQSTGWGWKTPSMPSLSAWRPFGSSPAPSESVARSRPSGKVDAPPAVGSSYAGSKGLAAKDAPSKDLAGAKDGAAKADPFASRPRDESPYGERPGAIAKASATSPYGADGYRTGPYATDSEKTTSPEKSAAPNEVAATGGSPAVYRGYSPDGVRLGASAAAGNSPHGAPGHSCAACDAAAKAKAADNGGVPRFKPSSSGSSVYASADETVAPAVSVATSGTMNATASEGSFDSVADEAESPPAAAVAPVSATSPAKYPVTRTPGLPAALSKPSGDATYRPGSTNRPVVPAGFNDAAVPTTTGSIYR